MTAVCWTSQNTNTYTSIHVRILHSNGIEESKPAATYCSDFLTLQTACVNALMHFLVEGLFASYSLWTSTNTHTHTHSHTHTHTQRHTHTHTHTHPYNLSLSGGLIAAPCTMLRYHASFHHWFSQSALAPETSWGYQGSSKPFWGLQLCVEQCQNTNTYISTHMRILHSNGGKQASCNLLLCLSNTACRSMLMNLFTF